MFFYLLFVNKLYKLTDQSPPIVQAVFGFMLSEKENYLVIIVYILFSPCRIVVCIKNILNDPHSLPFAMRCANDKLSLQSVKAGLMEIHIFRRTEIRIRLTHNSKIVGDENLLEKSAVVFLIKLSYGAY